MGVGSITRESAQGGPWQRPDPAAYTRLLAAAGLAPSRAPTAGSGSATLTSPRAAIRQYASAREQHGDASINGGLGA
jgi:hypothetical protein